MRLIKDVYWGTTLFFLMFSIHVSFLPNSRYIGLAMLFIGYFVHVKGHIKIRLPNDDVKWLLFLVFQLLYTFFITFYRDELNSKYANYISYTFNFLIMTTIVPYVLMQIFDKSDDFCRLFAIVTVFQSIIVLLSFFVPSVRQLLMSIQDAEIWEDFKRYGRRIIGLGIVGAGGSIYLCSGLIAFIYYLLFPETKKATVIQVVSLIVIYFAIALVGRTGFYVASILLVYYLLKSITAGGSKTLNNILIIVIGLFAAVVFYSSISNSDNVNNDLLQYTVNRLGAIFSEDKNPLIGVTTMYEAKTPGISWYTLWGAGIIRGYSSNGLYFWNDSGYAKRYADIGLIMTVISYSVMMIYYFKKRNKSSRTEKTFFTLLIIIMFAIEYKEHFIFMLSMPLTILMIMMFSNRNNSKTISTINIDTSTIS